jgi:two-component system response regulator LytT
VTALRALVLEDEWPTRNYLVELIEASQQAEVVGAVATLDEARQALAGLAVDVLFVDVQLTGKENGLDFLRSLKAEGNAPMFVLSTAFAEHAIEAFDLGAIDYILKPYSEERVAQCLRRLVARQPPKSEQPRRMVARRKHGLVFLDPSDIWAFEAANRLTFVHSRHGKFDVDLSLAAIEASFGRGLARVHRNWLVNLEFAWELERQGGETTLFVGSAIGDAQGIHVPVSRDRSQPVRDLLLSNSAGMRRS